MLYDPKWEIEIKANPFSLESLIAWLEKQPADTHYDYCVPGDCMVARYLKAQGVENYSLDHIDLHRLGWRHIAQDQRASGSQDWTFGGALTRAKAALR